MKDESHVDLFQYECYDSNHEDRLPIGIRDIYTYDSITDVLTKLGFTDVQVLADYIQEIQSIEYASIDKQRDSYNELTCKTDDAEFSIYNITDNVKQVVHGLLLLIEFYDHPDMLFSLQFQYCEDQPDYHTNNCYYLDYYQVSYNNWKNTGDKE